MISCTSNSPCPPASVHIPFSNGAKRVSLPSLNPCRGTAKDARSPRTTTFPRLFHDAFEALACLEARGASMTKAKRVVGGRRCRLSGVDLSAPSNVDLGPVPPRSLVLCGTWSQSPSCGPWEDRMPRVERFPTRARWRRKRRCAAHHDATQRREGSECASARRKGSGSVRNRPKNRAENPRRSSNPNSSTKWCKVEARRTPCSCAYVDEIVLDQVRAAPTSGSQLVPLLCKMRAPWKRRSTERKSRC